jgi:hypothetical protein
MRKVRKLNDIIRLRLDLKSDAARSMRWWLKDLALRVTHESLHEILIPKNGARICVAIAKCKNVVLIDLSETCTTFRDAVREDFRISPKNLFNRSQSNQTLSDGTCFALDIARRC